MSVTERDDTGSDVLERMIAESASPFPADRKRAVRGRVMSHVRRDAALARGRLVFRRALATFTVTATVLGGVSYAAAASLPGDPLYSVKRASEEVTLSVLPDGAMRQRFLFTVATRRADEIARMSAEESGTPLYLQTMEQFQAATSAAYGDGSSSSTPESSETKLKERVEAAPEPVREELEQAIQNADPEEPAMDGSGTGQGQGDSSTTTEPAPEGQGSPSKTTTGPASTGKP